MAYCRLQTLWVSGYIETGHGSCLVGGDFLIIDQETGKDNTLAPQLLTMQVGCSALLLPIVAGDKVTAGTVNYDGQISVQAVHSGGDTGELITRVLPCWTVHASAAGDCLFAAPASWPVVLALALACAACTMPWHLPSLLPHCHALPCPAMPRPQLWPTLSGW